MLTQTNRVAVITGAAGGVGQSTVKKFAEQGYTVIGTDIEPDGLFEHASVSYRACDVTSEQTGKHSQTRSSPNTESLMYW